MSDRARDRKRKPQTAGREIEPAPSRAFPLGRVLKNISFGCFFVRQDIIFCNKPYTDWTCVRFADFFFLDLDIFLTSLLTNETQKSKNSWAHKSTEKQVLASKEKTTMYTKLVSFFFAFFFSLSLLLSKRAEFCVGHEDPPGRGRAPAERDGQTQAAVAERDPPEK